jgi:hypothetical protein
MCESMLKLWEKIQFFEWESIGTNEESWWARIEKELPNLAKAGFTQIWFPRQSLSVYTLKGELNEAIQLRIKPWKRYSSMWET